MNMPNHFVAEGVLLTAHAEIKSDLLRWANSPKAPSYQRALSEIPGSKKLFYDEAVCHLVEKTRSIDTEILAQLSHVSFPFDSFWIEGSAKLVAIANKPFTNPDRMGFLITADQDTHTFSFLPYHSFDMPSRNEDYLRSVGVKIPIPECLNPKPGP